MAKVKNEDEKTEQTVGATVDVNPEDVKLQAFLEAEVEKLNAELEAARVRIAELEAQLEQAASPAVEAVAAQERYQAGGEAAADAEVVAIIQTLLRNFGIHASQARQVGQTCNRRLGITRHQIGNRCVSH